jgi:hypothetical protein
VEEAHMDSKNSTMIGDFTLMPGGPLDSGMLKVGLGKPGPRYVGLRMIIFSLVTWLPLLIFSMIQGLAVGNAAKVPFLYDFSGHARFLFALPLLFLAEMIIAPRVRTIIQHFRNQGIIPSADLPKFEAAINRAALQRDSRLPELIILILVVIVNVTGLRVTITTETSTWAMLLTDAGPARTIAGWWQDIISIPIYQIVLYRWVWRLIIWSMFLWKVAQLKLRLMPTHPDMAGGLGFLGMGHAKFAILILAVSSVIAAGMANQILYAGASLASYKFFILGYVLCIILVILMPLAPFAPTLLATKSKGLEEYGVLATTYTNSFNEKWVRGNNPEGEALLGAADIQSLADLGNSFAVIKKMNAFPLDLNTIKTLVLAAALPFVPLLFFVMPAKEAFKLARKLLLSW